MSSFFDDVEDIYERKEARDYKRRAQAAMNKNTLKKTAAFQKTWKRWREENVLRSAMRDGLWTPPKQPSKVDGAKVAYTFAVQLANLTQAILFITIGLWPLVFLTIPAIVLYNLVWLLNQQRGE